MPFPLSTKLTPVGSVPFSASAGVGEPEAVTVNVPGCPTVNVALFALVIDGAVGAVVPKKIPLTTPFG